MRLKSLHTIVFVLLCCYLNAQRQETPSESIVIEGIYQGKNLYVKNPFAPKGVGFCLLRVMVNGEMAMAEKNSSSFEVDFTNFGFVIGDPIEVEIVHRKGCTPEVENPMVLRPKSTYEVTQISVNSNNQLQWSTENETGSLPFSVEQFRWNKWIKIGEVKGKGTPELNTYQSKLMLHSGENKFRVKQLDFTGKPRISKVTTFTPSDLPEVNFYPKWKVKHKIVFSRESRYQVYNIDGELLKDGIGDHVKCSNLPKGKYYLNYDNKTDEFFKNKTR
jgi:hypothetical protein